MRLNAPSLLSAELLTPTYGNLKIFKSLLGSMLFGFFGENIWNFCLLYAEYLDKLEKLLTQLLLAMGNFVK